MTTERSFPQRKKARILIVDDHPIVRRGLIQLIGHDPDLVVCGEAEDAHGALAAIAENAPDLAVVDISLKGSNGIDLLKQIRSRFPRLKVIVLSMHDEALYAERALKTGAKGYIMKQEAPEQILGAVRTALDGEVFVSERMKRRLLQRMVGQPVPASGSPQALLSDRELEIYELIGRGLGTRRIAESLHVSVKTVETHRAHIKEKLHLESGSELVRHAVQWLDRVSKSSPAPSER